jgi:hypothetical protein
MTEGGSTESLTIGEALEDTGRETLRILGGRLRGREEGVEVTV